MIERAVVFRGERDIGVGLSVMKVLQAFEDSQQEVELLQVIPRQLRPFGTVGGALEVIEAEILYRVIPNGERT